MLQRIQTVYLLITFLLTVLMYFIPMGGVFVESTASVSDITLVGMDMPDGTKSFAWGMLLLSIIILVINVIGIGLYMKRIFQIRFNVLNIILNVALYIFYFFFAWLCKEKIGEGDFVYKLPIVFPVINIILTYLAIRAIGRDEALVRSLDRLR